ncbi:hypothetical protein DWZ34_13160 [Phocaeicola plebeius]|jgi:hypothetical protein|uniref:Uncharacterized protein n=2 Tax=Phocaeicola plebeius TaxID=310297 RepID=A0A415SZ81_9BACT|nr:hypothetical protein DW982_08805 [Phocaeicola plebeius]RHM94263.1 hypothetical protein DWZ34_13160 [Phocaeicola plebeius]DAK76453.1 MAG TPA: hypothetical protein [Caudoviricetes sp.]
MIKFFFDAMYYQFFIYNRDKFKLEDPHERTILLFCGILFLPIIALIYPLIKENFNYDLPFIFFVPIFYILYYFLNRYYVRKGIEIIREKPLLFKSQRLSFIISWMVYPFLAVLLYFMITHRHWLKII